MAVGPHSCHGFPCGAAQGTRHEASDPRTWFIATDVSGQLPPCVQVPQTYRKRGPATSKPLAAVEPHPFCWPVPSRNAQQPRYCFCPLEHPRPCETPFEQNIARPTRRSSHRCHQCTSPPKSRRRAGPRIRTAATVPKARRRCCNLSELSAMMQASSADHTMGDGASSGHHASGTSSFKSAIKVWVNALAKLGGRRPLPGTCPPKSQECSPQSQTAQSSGPYAPANQELRQTGDWR